MKTKWWAIALVLFTTLLTSAAQMFYKYGVQQLVLDTANLNSLMGLASFIVSLVWQVLFTPPITVGIICYAMGFLLLILAYKGGEATTLYPIFSSSYIWVIFLSNYFFGEPFSPMKIGGVLIIVLGITLVVRGGQDSAVTMGDPV